MNLTNLLERVAGKQHERQQSREADFRALVIEIADGADPDPNFVDRVLMENQKNIDDLRNAVELLLHRRQLWQTWDKAAGSDKDRDRIQKKIVEADNVLEQVELQHEETTAPLYARLDLIKQARAEADRADRRDVKAKSLEGEAAKLREQIKQLDLAERRLRDQMLEPWFLMARLISWEGKRPQR